MALVVATKIKIWKISELLETLLREGIDWSLAKALILEADALPTIQTTYLDTQFREDYLWNPDSLQEICPAHHTTSIPSMRPISALWR